VGQLGGEAGLPAGTGQLRRALEEIILAMEFYLTCLPGLSCSAPVILDGRRTGGRQRPGKYAAEAIGAPDLHGLPQTGEC